MNSKRKILLLISFALSLMLAEHYFRKRPDVITTDWLAPIIWEGTYNRQVLEKYYRRLNITIGLAIFAAGEFEDQYLKQFIQSADKHFMHGYNVIFYTMMDEPSRLPRIELGPLHTFKLVLIFYENTWQHFNLILMKNLGVSILSHMQDEVNLLFVMTINIFKNDFGVETLGKSVAQLHAWWYFKNANYFPCERNSKSAAFIPFGQGDFYYHSAIFGGIPEEVLKLIEENQKGIIHDTKKELTSIYESHLNKYFFLHKPTKLLSPEYNWDPNFHTPPQIKHIQIAWQSEKI
ncbi:LOW QUALITY PROTEIN: glycosyltransferase 6 domain-containing protein 1-like [Dugong dugon]